MLGVALLAGFLFIGGGAAIYLSSPQQPDTSQLVADSGTPGPSLEIFVQQTPTPIPTPEPTPTPVPSFSFDLGTPSPLVSPTESPTFEITPTPTAASTPQPNQNPPPANPTPTPTATATPAPNAKFGAAQEDGTLRYFFSDKSTGKITEWSWDFGDGDGVLNKQNPKHRYGSPGEYTVTLKVTGPGGSDTRSKKITVVQPVTPPPTTPPSKPPTAPPPTAPSEPPSASPSTVALPAAKSDPPASQAAQSPAN